MNKRSVTVLLRFTALLLMFFTTVALQADDKDVLNNKIKLTKNKGTIYQLLNEVSNQSGYLFIYDSQVLNNDQHIKIRRGEYSLQSVIYAITGNPRLKISVVGNYILLRLPINKENPDKQSEETSVTQNNFITLTGTLYDRLTNEPVIYGSVSIANTTIGTVSNQNGSFKLIIPDSLNHSLVKFSHVGYETKTIKVALLTGQNFRLPMEPRIIPLQEIVVRTVDPKQAIRDMISHKENNYPDKPTLQTTFYREGIDYKNKNIDLTEAVLQVYKSPYQNRESSDQVKMIKMRRVISEQDNDSILPKMKSGISSCLYLDVIKSFPDFFNTEEPAYTYTHTDINVVDDRRINVISFEQEPQLKQPLYKGTLFIDAENSALHGVRFEVNPGYIEKATGLYIEKKNPKIKLTLQQVKYTISYKPSEDEKFHINHIRGDIVFKVRKKRHLLSTALHFWFEMANCKTDTENIKGFPRSERIIPSKIFSDTRHEYDKDFWGHFNIILPEDKLKELILTNLNEVMTNE